MMASASLSAEATVTVIWHAISSTIAVALLGLVATISGAFIGASRSSWRLGYVTVWVVLLVAVFDKEIHPASIGQRGDLLLTS